MDHARGEPKQNGGWLIHYLEMNVKPDLVENAAEQADLAAIAENPISNWIWTNGKFLLFAFGFLVILAILRSN